MGRARAAWRLLRAALHTLYGLLLVWVLFPRLGRAQRQAQVQAWAARMLQLLGLRLEVQGRVRPGGTLLVANHVSWLDIMVVHAVCPQARFVAKAQLRLWPLLGRLVDGADTIYIERERKRDALRVAHQCAQALHAGDTVLVFPEGTTGPGAPLLPFHASLLQAAIAVAAPVQPLALRYADRQRPVSASAQWLGATTLWQSAWRLARAEGLVVHLCLGLARGSAHAERRRLAQTLRIDIETALTEIDRRHPHA